MIFKCKSNAKINISLRIVGYEKGYHLLNSIFVPINLYDDLEFSESDKDEIIGFNIPKEENIIYKTICLIRSKYKINKFVKVVVKKNIPMQAGLGGGSSNAAATIKALNEIWYLKLSVDEKLELAKEIGSDVPFFIINETSYVTGRGENVQPIEFNKINGILIFDNAYFSTPEVYKNFDKLNIELTSNQPKFNGNIEYINDLQKAIVDMKGYDIVSNGINDLLETNAKCALLSGSGGSVFGIYDCDLAELEKAYLKLKDKHIFVYKFSSI